MTKKKYLIGITGKARSGKDTLGKRLLMSHGFHRMAFADPLKSSMAATFGIAVEEFHSDTLKDEVHPLWNLTRRAMLQQGADALRGQFGQDLFVRRWLNAYLPLADQEHVVVTDVRNDDEAQTIRDLGGIILHVSRDGAGLTGEAGAHHTESGVNHLLIDRRLSNHSSKDDLRALLDAVLAGMSEAPLVA